MSAFARLLYGEFAEHEAAAAAVNGVEPGRAAASGVQQLAL